MAHNRKLVIGGVALVQARLRNTGPAMVETCDELEQVLINAGWFPAAPFQWVGLIIRYGLKNEGQPHFQRINKKYGDLPIAIEVDTHQLLEIHKEPHRLKTFFKGVTIDCLLSVARRYNIPAKELENERATLITA
ncbi:MAG: hypothetical protein FJ145_10765 [Deltaproteobacteria bacterium]|nr:hypothetical protein [Deltaproteobacteria bacterium]